MSVRSDRRERAEGVACAHRALNAPHDDAAGAFGTDGRRADLVESVYGAEELAAADVGSDFRGGHEEAVVRRGVMNLEMSFVGVFGRALDLRAQFRGALRWHDFEGGEQVAQTAVEVTEVARVDVASAAALDVDGRDLAGMGRAERAAGQKRAVPAPEGVEARGHRALCAVDRFFVRDETGPRQQFVGAAGAVQIDVVGDLREELGVEHVRESLRDRAAGVARKGAGEVEVVGGIRAEAGVERALVQHGHHHDGAAEIFRTPALGPLAEEGGALVFIAVRGPVQQEHGTGRVAAPNEGIKSDATDGESALVKAGQELLKIDGKFGSGGTHG